jgi:hypothetical protein
MSNSLLVYDFILFCYPRTLQSKVLRLTADALLKVPNTVIQTNPPTLSFKEEIRHYNSQYNASLISVHSNDLVLNLVVQPGNNRRL